MSDKKTTRFSTLFFVLVLKTSVLSLVRPPPTRTCDKTAVLSNRKKPSEKKFSFFFIEQIVNFPFDLSEIREQVLVIIVN
jgi:hypothetical protein